MGVLPTALCTAPSEQPGIHKVGLTTMAIVDSHHTALCTAPSEQPGIHLVGLTTMTTWKAPLATAVAMQRMHQLIPAATARCPKDPAPYCPWRCQPTRLGGEKERGSGFRAGAAGGGVVRSTAVPIQAATRGGP